MKKTLLFWLYFIASIALAVYFVTRMITNYMGRGPISNVQNIKIISDSKNNDVELIKMAVGIPSGTNIRYVDLHQINNRILAIPGIKKASTRKLPNGNLIIKTQHHDAVAIWTDGISYYPLSSDGTKIDTPKNIRDANAIVFRGKVPDNLTDIINAVSVLTDYIDYIEQVESRRLNIYTKNGIVIYLPETNPIAAVNKINELNQTHKLLSRKLDIIDLRDGARILVKEHK